MNIPTLSADETRTKDNLRSHFQLLEEQQLHYPASLKGGATTRYAGTVALTKAKAWAHIFEVHFGIPCSEEDMPGEAEEKLSNKQDGLERVGDMANNLVIDQRYSKVEEFACFTGTSIATLISWNGYEIRWARS